MSAPVKAAASHAREGLPPPLGDAAPAEGARDERPTTMADDIFEIAALPVNVPRVKAAPAEGRADLAFDGLPCGRPGSETPDKPPRA